MSGRSNGLEMALAKMADAGVDPVAIETFAHYYRLLEHGETGMIPEASIEPVDIESLADADVPDDVAADALGKTVAIKLNGGLGTSMGMERAKSLLCVRRGLSFLDIIARQALHLRAAYGVRALRRVPTALVGPGDDQLRQPATQLGRLLDRGADEGVGGYRGPAPLVRRLVGHGHPLLYGAHVVPEDVQALFIHVAAHRLAVEADGGDGRTLAKAILHAVPVD